MQALLVRSLDDVRDAPGKLGVDIAGSLHAPGGRQCSRSRRSAWIVAPIGPVFGMSVLHSPTAPVRHFGGDRRPYSSHDRLHLLPDHRRRGARIRRG